MDVLERIADGRTNPEIAAELFLTVPTVKSYVNQVFAKLGVRTRAEAVARVLR
ncbi:helix-turn-helix transcriptional regulator [Curtobacterium flaccumfaciens]|nr:helix-turn-helix transcriptional regulator [Curtobacterium flaccumfaciens]